MAEFGQYLIKYSAVDTFNIRPNEVDISYAVFVTDNILPVVTFKEAPVTSVKVGATIKIPEFVVTDNNKDGEVRVTCFVYTPEGKYEELPADVYAVKADRAGIWKLCIYAIDAAGNLRVETIEIEVKA